MNDNYIKRYASEDYVAEEVAKLPQADWNQNDETAKDYVKNRTHYVEPDTLEATLEECALNFTDFSDTHPFNRGGSGYGHAISDFVYAESNITTEWSDLRSGVPYRVVWDGVTYDCVATEGDGMETFVLGNLSLYDSSKTDTGEPFLIYADVCYDSQGLYIFSNDTADATHTLSFGFITNGAVHTLSDEYLPTIPVEKGGTGFDVLEIDGTEEVSTLLLLTPVKGDVVISPGQLFVLYLTKDIGSTVTTAKNLGLRLNSGIEGYMKFMGAIDHNAFTLLNAGRYICLCLDDDTVLIIK